MKRMYFDTKIGFTSLKKSKKINKHVLKLHDLDWFLDQVGKKVMRPLYYPKEPLRFVTFFLVDVSDSFKARELYNDQNRNFIEYRIY